MLPEKDVDSLSSAALLIERELFMRVGGFDLAFEPGGYEDADLCFKVRAVGRTVLSCPDSTVVRCPAAAADGDAAEDARRKALRDINWDKFTARWGPYLGDGSDAAIAAVLPAFIPSRWEMEGTARDDRPSAAVYTPYALTPGGGERYILSIARRLSETHNTTLVTPHRYSRLRLRNITCELDIDLSAVSLATEEEFAAGPEPEIMFAMGNTTLPRLPGRGRVKVYYCQFPFLYQDIPGSGPEQLASYTAVIANSAYARRHYVRALVREGLPPIDTQVVYPAVQFIGGGDRKEPLILSVGRFFGGEHSKRHDQLIEAFREMIVDSVPAELVIAGSSTPDKPNMDYLASLRAAAEGYPIRILANPSLAQLNDLFRRASVYWHGKGMSSDLIAKPSLAEHFGITLVEAMSAGAIPFAFDAGGPHEIIHHGEDGFLYRDVLELIDWTATTLANELSDDVLRMRAAARVRANDFSPKRFDQRVSELVRSLAPA